LILKILSSAAEDCLLYVQRLTERSQEVSTSALAKGLGVSDSTVTVMVQKLARQKLLEYVPRREIALTEHGADVAGQLIRRHRLIEAYLHDKLGYSWEEIHAEAERIEHAVSEKFVDAIEKELGYPKFDPHGDPIPDKQGLTKERKLKRLSDLHVGEAGKIARVLDGKPNSLVYLSELGLHLGADVVVTASPKDDAIVKLSIEGREAVIGAAMAESIMVEGAGKG
jgi:DtxR family Mn-dependent transcriptional regulator